MAISMDDLLAEMPKEQRDRILRRSRELIAEEAALQAALDAEADAERRAISGKLTFTVYRDDGGGFRFQLRGQKGEILLDSPPFADKAQARAALEGFRRRVADAEFADQTEAVV